MSVEHNFEYIRDTYGVPARKGIRVEFQGKGGVITGAKNGKVEIRLDGEKHKGLYHPTWELTYEGDK